MAPKRPLKNLRVIQVKRTQNLMKFFRKSRNNACSSTSNRLLIVFTEYPEYRKIKFLDFRTTFLSLSVNNLSMYIASPSVHFGAKSYLSPTSQMAIPPLFVYLSPPSLCSVRQCFFRTKIVFFTSHLLRKTMSKVN